MFKSTNIGWEVVSVSEQTIESQEATRPHYNQYDWVLEVPKKEPTIFKKEWLIKKVLRIAVVKGVQIPTYSGVDYRLSLVNNEFKITLNNQEFALYVGGAWEVVQTNGKREVLEEILPIVTQLISSEA